MAKKIIIDQNKCIGCGSCAAIAPKTFKMNDEMKAEIIDGEHDDEQTIQLAADSCPTQAISLEEE